MAILTKERRSSSHWYTADGAPAHKQPRATGGGLRPTTLADARKLKLFPSVTTVTGIMAKPQLDQWKLNQVGLTAFANLPTVEETAEYYAKRIVSQSMEPTDVAANFGTDIHDALEKTFAEGVAPPDEFKVFVDPVLRWFKEKELEFLEAERRVLNKKRGYAGMADLIARGKGGQAAVIDWKTRKTREGQAIKPYDWQPEQIAAYAAAYWGEADVMAGRVYGANVYISSTEPGRMEVVTYDPDQLKAHYEIFLTIASLWRYMKNYDPRS